MFIFHVYVSPEHAASFTGPDKLHPVVKNQFPSLTRKKIRKWAESNLSYSLHKPSRRTLKRNKVCAPEIDSLWEADLAFVQDVAEENDGGNYLLVVILMYFQNVHGSDQWKTKQLLVFLMHFTLSHPKVENLRN